MLETSVDRETIQSAAATTSAKPVDNIGIEMLLTSADHISKQREGPLDGQDVADEGGQGSASTSPSAKAVYNFDTGVLATNAGDISKRRARNLDGQDVGSADDQGKRQRTQSKDPTLDAEFGREDGQGNASASTSQKPVYNIATGMLLTNADHVSKRRDGDLDGRDVWR